MGEGPYIRTGEKEGPVGMKVSTILSFTYVQKRKF